MTTEVQTFTYTAQRALFIRLLGVILLLMVPEVCMVVLFIVLLVPNILIKGLLLLLYVGLLIFIANRLSGVARTKHQLSESSLRLRFGSSLHVDIPRDAITSAQPVHENVGMFEPTSASYNASRKQIRALFSDQGQVLLRLKEPLALNVRGTLHLTEYIIINVDKRAAFLAALAVSESEKANTSTISTIHSDGVPVLSVLERPRHSVLSGQEPVIHIENLTREFAGFMAVDHLSMSIQPGEIYGFLGSNGAGKTTTIKMLVGLLEPSAGHVFIAGHDVWKEPVVAKTNLGYVADHALLYERLSGRDFLHFLAQMHGLPLNKAQQRVEYLLALLDLVEHADRLCGSYSLGMKRKLSLAGALIHQPTVLILDEPLNGLDPRSARRLKDLLLEMATSGTTILLSTHDLSTAEMLCHRVGIMHRGRLMAEGSAAELRQMLGVSDLEAVFLNLTDVSAEGVAV
jgi:ABC-2 type transport system ATP-binding protein